MQTIICDPQAPTLEHHELHNFSHRQYSTTTVKWNNLVLLSISRITQKAPMTYLKCPQADPAASGTMPGCSQCFSLPCPSLPTQHFREIAHRKEGVTFIAWAPHWNEAADEY